MRVHEFAKKKGLSSKEVLSLLEKGGHGVPSHMSVLSEQAQAFLEKKLSASAKSAAAEKVAAKTVKKTVLATEKTKKTVAKAATALTGSRPASPKETHSAPASTTKKAGTPAVRKKASATSPLPRPATQPASRRPAGRRRSKKSYQRKERVAPVVPEVVTEISVGKEMYLHEVADMMGKPSGELILILLKKGMVCNRNQILSVDTIAMLAEALQITVNVKRPTGGSVDAGFTAAAPEHSVTRWPIVVVMGHVDHGKTTLLDYIRKHNVAAREKGGITQHLGAYEVDSTHGKIVFLDTPGHQAFSYMRKKGAKVTDIAILVVAADDGIMPQTLEAIQHARDAQVPMIVAINKIDKPENKTAAIETVKRQLAENNLMPEDWGGQTICVPISAKTGEGVDELLEMIVLQAEMSELKANPNASSQAFILESKLEKGFGPVATVIPLEGTIKQGDYFVCGSSTGKVRLLINSAGKRIMQAGPSIPVQVVGFDKFVSLGEWLKVVPFKEYSKARAAKASVVSQMSAPSADFMASQEEEQASINLIIKTDTQGSGEAIIGSLEELGKKHKKIPASFNVIQHSIGNISESDVTFAADTGAMIIGLHVKFEKNSANFAKDKGVKIMSGQIIYKLLEDLEKILLTYRVAKITLKKVAQAVVRKVFDVKVGVIAGCYVQEGVVTRKCIAVCMRSGQKIGEGKITSLQREKKSVKEVHAGYECGFITEGFGGWQEEDTVEFYIEEKEQLS